MAVYKQMEKLSALSVIVRFSDAIGINPNHVTEVTKEDGSGFKWIVTVMHITEQKYYVSFDPQTGVLEQYVLIKN